MVIYIYIYTLLFSLPSPDFIESIVLKHRSKHIYCSSLKVFQITA